MYKKAPIPASTGHFLREYDILLFGIPWNACEQDHNLA